MKFLKSLGALALGAAPYVVLQLAHIPGPIGAIAGAVSRQLRLAIASATLSAVACASAAVNLPRAERVKLEAIALERACGLCAADPECQKVPETELLCAQFRDPAPTAPATTSSFVIPPEPVRKIEPERDDSPSPDAG